MRTTYLFSLLFFLVWFATNNVVAQQSDDTGAVKPIDHIVAVVNGECITRQELNEVLKLSIKQLQKQGIEPPSKEILEGQVLEREILTRVQLQLANEIGITVGDTELEKALN